MHYADFAQLLLKEIEQKIIAAEAPILGGNVQDWSGYQKVVARRMALLEMREMIIHALGRDEARL